MRHSSAFLTEKSFRTVYAQVFGCVFYVVLLFLGSRKRGGLRGEVKSEVLSRVSGSYASYETGGCA